MWAVYCNDWYWGGRQLDEVFETQERAEAYAEEMNLDAEENSDDFEKCEYEVKEVYLDKNNQYQIK